jgi:gluconokinase
MRSRRAQFLILSIDIGSSSTRSALFDDRARRWHQSNADVQYSISYTTDGGAELAPRTLYRAVRRAISESLQMHDRVRSRQRLPIRAIATSAFWHGLLGVDRQWRPVTPIYTWADARAAGVARELRVKLSERDVHARTGCMLHASFWPAKLTWLHRTRPQLFRSATLWVSPVDWIYHELFGTTVSSASMVSATGLYDLTRSAWDEKLCATCHVDSKQLLHFGQLIEPVRLPPALHAPVDVFTAIGDGAAGNLGSGAEKEGAIAINVGTSAAVRVIQSTREAKAAKLPLGLFRYVVDGQRTIMGGAVSNAGNLRQWALHELRLKDNPSSNRQVFARAFAARDRLTVLPFWAGERAPTWPDYQRGVIDGMTHSTTAIELLRALSSSVFYRLADILDLTATAGVKPRRIIVSGGILRSIPAVRLLADAMGRDVEAAGEREASLRGAAVYALQQLGVKVPALRPGSCIKHNRKLAEGHLIRRQRQHALEKALTKADL